MYISKLKFFIKSVVQGHSFFVPYYCSFHHPCCMAASSAHLYSNLCESDSTHLITFNYNVLQLIWGFGNGYCLTHKIVCCVSLYKMLLIKDTGSLSIRQMIKQWFHHLTYFSEFMVLPSHTHTHTHTHTHKVGPNNLTGTWSTLHSKKHVIVLHGLTWDFLHISSSYSGSSHIDWEETKLCHKTK
jgi:hypothetical protein